MPRYFKAVHLKELQAFEAWQDDLRTDASEDDVVFLDESLVVRADCFEDAEVIFQSDSAEWKHFCQDQLGFKVPDWERESAEVRRKLREAGEIPDSDT